MISVNNTASRSTHHACATSLVYNRIFRTMPYHADRLSSADVVGTSRGSVRKETGLFCMLHRAHRVLHRPRPVPDQCVLAAHSATIAAGGRLCQHLGHRYVCSEHTANNSQTAQLGAYCHPGAGVTGDITIPEERGGYYSLFNLGPMVAPCVGPAVGGALAENLGWRSTFWALVVVAGFCLLVLYLYVSYKRIQVSIRTRVLI